MAYSGGTFLNKYRICKIPLKYNDFAFPPSVLTKILSRGIIAWEVIVLSPCAKVLTFIGRQQNVAIADTTDYKMVLFPIAQILKQSNALLIE